MLTADFIVLVLMNLHKQQLYICVRTTWSVNHLTLVSTYLD